MSSKHNGRACKPKSKTGCKTCRARRVKCDEGKPFCARCLKFGADCDGYETGTRSKAPREIMPRANGCPQYLVSSLGKHPGTAVFQDNREYSYFLYFQEEASHRIASHFDQSLFSHVLIQASWNEPSLSQLIASLGALHKAELPRRSGCITESNPHRQYAFKQFGKALRSVQARISTGQQTTTVRVVLIASLLIYCFESMHGDIDSALKHLESGLQLMHRRLIPARRRHRHFENRSPTPDLDDDLVAAFFRLDSNLGSRSDVDGKGASGNKLCLEYLEHFVQVPQHFDSVSIARNYLEHIQFPVVPKLARDLYQVCTPSSSTRKDLDDRNIYTTSLLELRQWKAAIAPLIANETKDSIAVATLRVRALSTEIAVERVCAESTSSLHQLKVLARSIVELSKSVAYEASFERAFVWDCGIVPGLTIAMLACNDLEIRTEALQILKDIVPRQEGAWDSMSAVKLGETLLELQTI